MGFALLLVLAAALAVYAARVLPQTQGAVTLDGPLAPMATLRIERDASGIPTIQAGDARDASFGLGFVHAQDRLWATRCAVGCSCRRRRRLRGSKAWGPTTGWWQAATPPPVARCWPTIRT
ncbi:MAG: penicillin acylase family protein [Rubrivivax sp.]